jgi:hypothetical protein
MHTVFRHRVRFDPQLARRRLIRDSTAIADTMTVVRTGYGWRMMRFAPVRTGFRSAPSPNGGWCPSIARGESVWSRAAPADPPPPAVG